jgi:hypothetical protein
MQTCITFSKILEYISMNTKCLFFLREDIYHITKYKYIRTNEIITFFENSFSWIVFSLITNTKNSSLENNMLIGVK